MVLLLSIIFKFNAMKSIILISFLSLFCFSLTAQENVKEQKLTGKLVKKEWTKSKESYCAGGSEYFVLEVNNSMRVIILQFDEKSLRVSKFQNKDIIIFGNHIEKEIESDNNLQHPANSSGSLEKQSFSCHVFNVTSISKIEN